MMRDAFPSETYERNELTPNSEVYASIMDELPQYCATTQHSDDLVDAVKRDHRHLDDEAAQMEMQ